MPAVAKTSAEAILRAARDLVAAGGTDALSMGAVAAVVGVSAPSLYKHFADRTALLDAVELQFVAEVRALFERAAAGKAPADALRAMTTAYRGHARTHPGLSALMSVAASSPATVEARRAGAAPVVAAFAALVGPQQAATATGALDAFLQGFVMLENADEIRLGPDIEAAFRLGLDSIIGAACLFAGVRDETPNHEIPANEDRVRRQGPKPAD